MKFTFAVACLLGVISADEPVWKLRSVNSNAANTKEQVAYAGWSTKQSTDNVKDWTHVQVDSESESDSEEENAQIAGDDEESDHSKEFYVPWDSVPDEIDGYHRVLPEMFSSGDSDDLFMRSMIKAYALEGKNKDGSPNGNFMMDEASTRLAASEVLDTHKGMHGDEKKKYLDQFFPRTFAHFDVTKEGKLEVIKMPQFMRFLASDQYMSL